MIIASHHHIQTATFISTGAETHHLFPTVGKVSLKCFRGQKGPVHSKTISTPVSLHGMASGVVVYLRCFGRLVEGRSEDQTFLRTRIDEGTAYGQREGPYKTVDSHLCSCRHFLILFFSVVVSWLARQLQIDYTTPDEHSGKSHVHVPSWVEE